MQEMYQFLLEKALIHRLRESEGVVIKENGLCSIIYRKNDEIFVTTSNEDKYKNKLNDDPIWVVDTESK